MTVQMIIPDKVSSNEGDGLTEVTVHLLSQGHQAMKRGMCAACHLHVLSLPNCAEFVLSSSPVSTIRICHFINTFAPLPFPPLFREAGGPGARWRDGGHAGRCVTRPSLTESTLRDRCGRRRSKIIFRVEQGEDGTSRVDARPTSNIV